MRLRVVPNLVFFAPLGRAAKNLDEVHDAPSFESPRPVANKICRPGGCALASIRVFAGPAPLVVQMRKTTDQPVALVTGCAVVGTPPDRGKLVG